MILKRVSLLLGIVFLVAGCRMDNSEVAPLMEDTADENGVVLQPGADPAALPLPGAARWAKPTHVSVAQVCAWQWGLSAGRQSVISGAADEPDNTQSGIEAGFNQQWSHAYLYTSLGFWIWGDADDDFHDNLDGDSGEWESPEGYNGGWAGKYYNRGDQSTGDWYLGYALHFMEDVGLILHSSFPSGDMLLYHFDFETWVNNNLTSGHNFLNEVASDWNYYPVSDPKEGIRSCAYGSSYWTSSLGETVWDAYVAAGYPTATGSGSSALVSSTREMVRRMGRYTKGAMKYALDKYGQWSDSY